VLKKLHVFITLTQSRVITRFHDSTDGHIGFSCGRHVLRMSCIAAQILLARTNDISRNARLIYMIIRVEA